MADDRRATSARRGVAVPAAIAVIAALAAVVFAITSSGEASISPSGAVAGPAPGAPSDPMALGDADAPVVMIIYSEFQCPFCGKFARDTEPELIERFVDTGIMRIEWRDFPYLGEESVRAAQAGRAAAAQGRFWEFHDRLYADQPPPNSGRLTTSFLEDVAAELGLDVARFRNDMSSDEVMAAIDADFTEGLRNGVNGTPAFVINGEPVFGAQPTAVFVEIIERAAATGTG